MEQTTQEATHIHTNEAEWLPPPPSWHTTNKPVCKSCPTSGVGSLPGSSTVVPRNSRLRLIAEVDSSSFALDPSATVESQDNYIRSIFRVRACADTILALKMQSFLTSHMFHIIDFTTKSPISIQAGLTDNL